MSLWAWCCYLLSQTQEINNKYTLFTFECFHTRLFNFTHKKNINSLHTVQKIIRAILSKEKYIHILFILSSVSSVTADWTSQDHVAETNRSCWFIWLFSWPAIQKKEKRKVTLILWNHFQKSKVGQAHRTALVKQVFNASNSFAHRSFLSSCLPVVVAATHFPYTAACWTTRVAFSNTIIQRFKRFDLSYVTLHGNTMVWQNPTWLCMQE